MPKSTSRMRCCKDIVARSEKNWMGQSGAPPWMAVGCPVRARTSTERRRLRATKAETAQPHTGSCLEASPMKISVQTPGTPSANPSYRSENDFTSISSLKRYILISKEIWKPSVQ